MLGLTCEKNCPDASWDFVTMHLLLSFVLWGVFFMGGLTLAFYSISVDVDETKEKVEIWQGRFQSSRIYVSIYGCFAIFQCCIFSIRTFSNTVDGITFLVELIACTIYMSNTVLSWLAAAFSGFSSILLFLFTEALVDSLIFPSVVCLMVIKVDGSLGWFSFSYVAAIHILTAWKWMLEIRRINLQTFAWQATDVTINIFVMIYFAAMMTMTLENLGDPGWLKDVNRDQWTTVSSVYYVFATISTVGYGDLAPLTAFGRLVAILTIFGGMLGLVTAIYRILLVLSLHSAGGGIFTPRISARHIIVSGNPTIQMCKDFISEVFHPDHAEDADDIHVVFLLPRGTATVSQINKEMKQRKNIHFAPRVHTYQGSVLETYDLMRVAPMHASAFFIMPNMQCKDYMHEDTENIIRMMSVLKINPQVRMILLLMKAENEQLLQEAGVGNAANITCLAVDQFKLELVGKSCEVPGFSSLICNLFKTIAEIEEEDYSGLGDWLQDYDLGSGMEIYEVELSLTYASRDAVFAEVVLDVLEQTDGLVYLIGIVESSMGGGRNKVIVNPGTWYPIKDPRAGTITSGLFIAADRDSVHQCDGGVFLGRRDRPQEAHDIMKKVVARTVKSDGSGKRIQKKKEEREAKKAAGMQAAASAPKEGVNRRDPNLNAEMQESARQLMKLARQQQQAAHPKRPPLKLLATGGHILFLCIGVHEGEELRLGAEHFLRPLRTDKGPGVEHRPFVVMAPVAPRDWSRVCTEKDVYYQKGSPLSLFDLEKANFRNASLIFVCHVGSPSAELMEPWMVDSEAICCARLIESELPPDSQLNIIVELSVDSNHPFIPLPHVAPKRTNVDGNRGSMMGLFQSFNPRSTTRATTNGASDRRSLSLPEFCSTCGHHFEENAMECVMCGTDRSAPGAMGVQEQGEANVISEYYRQPRYACGQLFVGNIITSLTVNTFFNPSLWELVHQMIKADVIMVPLPRDWEGKAYYEFFDKLLREDDLMAVAIYRLSEAEHGRKKKEKQSYKQWSYVFTAPPAKETHMLRGDRVICFGSAYKIREDAVEPEQVEDVVDEEDAEKEKKNKRPRVKTPKPGKVDHNGQNSRKEEANDRVRKFYKGKTKDDAKEVMGEILADEATAIVDEMLGFDAPSSTIFGQFMSNF